MKIVGVKAFVVVDADIAQNAVADKTAQIQCSGFGCFYFQRRAFNINTIVKIINSPHPSIPDRPSVTITLVNTDFRIKGPFPVA